MEFVINTPEINIGGTATKELDLYENKKTAEIGCNEKHIDNLTIGTFIVNTAALGK